MSKHRHLALASAMALALVSSTVFAAAGWSDDYDKGLAQAKAEKKLVLLDFTGSDWCGWCKKLQAEVFTTKEFDTFAKNKLVLVEIDFPSQKKQSAELKKANEALQEKYKASGFPTIVALNGEGKEVWRQVGYMAGGPRAWIAKLEPLK